MARQWEALVAETESPTMAERAAAWRESERPEASAAAAELQSMPDAASQNGGRLLATAEDEMARQRARSHLSVSPSPSARGSQRPPGCSAIGSTSQQRRCPLNRRA